MYLCLHQLAYVIILLYCPHCSCFVSSSPLHYAGHPIPWGSMFPLSQGGQPFLMVLSALFIFPVVTDNKRERERKDCSPILPFIFICSWGTPENKWLLFIDVRKHCPRPLPNLVKKNVIPKLARIQ